MKTVNKNPENLSKDTTKTQSSGKNTSNASASSKKQRNSPVNKEDTSKSFDRDQEELSYGFREGDLDTDIPRG